MAGYSRRSRLLACGVYEISALGSARGLASAVEQLANRSLCSSSGSVYGLHDHPGSSPCSGCAKKNGPDQALGRSRGGLSTKIHAATIDENCSVALHLTEGQAHDGRQFETLYESLEAENVLESAALDKGYDADRIRERLAFDGIQPVIPPISSRSKKLSYDRELYRQRNRIERFFNKIKAFRRIATRYDKLRKTFFAALHLVSAFLIVKNS